MPYILPAYADPFFPIRFHKGYENFFLDFDDFDVVKDFVDAWGLLYVTPKRELELKYIDYYQVVKLKDEDLFKNLVEKASRQEAREPFYYELQTLRLCDMSPNCRWVAEELVKVGLAQFII